MNSSGKTFYSVSIAQCIFLNQIGMMVPCDNIKLPIFNSILFRKDISDNIYMGKYYLAFGKSCLLFFIFTHNHFFFFLFSCFIIFF